MRCKALLLVALVLVLASGPARAYLYSYDFSTIGFSEGQVVEGITLGVAALTSESADMWYTNAYGGGFVTEGGGTWGGSTADIYMSFSQAIDRIIVRGGDGAGDLDAFALSLYRWGTNDFIGTFASPLFGGPNEPEWYTMDLAGYGDIGRVVLDPGNSGALPGTLDGEGGIAFIELGYNTAVDVVPEPASLLLLGTGLFGLAAYARRNRLHR